MEGFISGDTRLTADYYLGHKRRLEADLPVTVEISATFWNLDSAEKFQAAVRDLLDES